MGLKAQCTYRAVYNHSQRFVEAVVYRPSTRGRVPLVDISVIVQRDITDL